MDTLTAANTASSGDVCQSARVRLPGHALAAVLPFAWQYYGPWILLAPYIRDLKYQGNCCYGSEVLMQMYIIPTCYLEWTWLNMT